MMLVCGPFRAGLVGGLAHAVLFGVAFPPMGWWLAALVAPIPLMVVSLRSDGPWRSAAGAGLAAVPMWAFHHQYVWAMSEAGIFPLVAYLALYPGLFVWMLGRVRRVWPGVPIWASGPVMWTGLEVVRGEVAWDGYAQYLIAHPFIDRWVAGLGAVVGVYGVGAMICVVAGLGAAAWVGALEGGRARWRGGVVAPLVLCGAGVVVVCVPAARVDREACAGGFRVAAIQTNVPQDNRASATIDERIMQFKAFCDLTREAAEAEPRPDLIVWPEAMFPGYALNAEAVEAEREAGLAYPGDIRTTVFAEAVIELQREVGVPLLIGGQAAEGLRFSPGEGGGVLIEQDALFNSVFMVRGGAVEAERYDKMQLMPFGEVMPYISNWDWLEERLLAIGGRGLTFDLEAGSSARVFRASGGGGRGGAVEARIATPICFEATFSRQMRRLAWATPRPDLFVNVSNDGWFAWYDAGREHVLQQCRWRCLELGVPMVRSVNTGISAVIDARGRVVERLEARRAGVLARTVDGRLPGSPIYGTIGDVAGWVCLGGMVALVVSTLVSGVRGSGPRAVGC